MNQTLLGWYDGKEADVYEVTNDNRRTRIGFKGKANGDKIDFIFAQPGVEVLRAEILRDCQGDRYPSDHFPVTAALRLFRPPAN